MGRYINCALAAAALAMTTTAGLAQEDDDTSLRVVATIPAAHSVVSAVLGDSGEAHLLIRGAASPHTYSLKPSDAQALAAADLVVWVGPGLETFLDGRLETLAPNARVVAWEDLPGTVLRDVRDGGEWDAHDHDHGHGHADEHDHGKHDHGHDEHDHGKHDHGHDSHDHDAHAHAEDKHGHRKGAEAHDPHLWLDPENASGLATVLARALGDIAPGSAEDFSIAAQAYTGRLAELDDELRAELAPVAGKRFLVFHDAYQYFEERYGLSGAGSVTLSPEVSPGAARVREIRNRIVEGDIVCVFAEPQFRPELVTTLIDGTSASAAVLDPVGASLEPGADLYPQLLRGLAQSLTGCLGPDA